MLALLRNTMARCRPTCSLLPDSISPILKTLNVGPELNRSDTRNPKSLMPTLGLPPPDGIHWVVKACAHPLQNCRQQPLGAFQTTLACFGNAHSQGACDVGLLPESHSGAEPLVRPYLQRRGRVCLHSATNRGTYLHFEVVMTG